MTAEVRSQKAEGRMQKGSLKIVFDFWRERPGWAAGLIAGTIAVTAISMVFPYLLRMIIDGIKRGITQPQLVRYVLFLVGFGFLRVVGEVLLPFSRGRINELYAWKVRTDVFRRVLNMGHTFTSKFPTGDVMERLVAQARREQATAREQVGWLMRGILALPPHQRALIRVASHEIEHVSPEARAEFGQGPIERGPIQFVTGPPEHR